MHALPDPGGSARDDAATVQSKHTRTLPPVYEAIDPNSRSIPVAPERWASISRTRPPVTPADVALWPAWTAAPLCSLGFVLLNADGERVGRMGA